MVIEPEVVHQYPASPVGVQTALVAVSHATLVAIETPLLPDGGSCVITAMSLTGRTGEEGHRTGIQGTIEGVGEVDPDLVHVVETT